MPNRIKDLTGKRFGKLVVIKRVENEKGRRANWLCRCDCGSIVVKHSNNLVKGTKSCGCLIRETARELARKLNSKNLIGNRYGKLLVIAQSDKRMLNGSIYWKCQCDCGNITDVRTDGLTRNRVISCGCIASKGERKIAQILRDNHISFEQQKKFEDCRSPYTHYHLKFDFFVNSQYLIEYDGIQHYRRTSYNLKDFKLRQEYDRLKTEYCKSHKIPLIRIPYTKYKTLCLDDLLLEKSKFVI